MACIYFSLLLEMLRGAGEQEGDAPQYAMWLQSAVQHNPIGLLSVQRYRAAQNGGLYLLEGVTVVPFSHHTLQLHFTAVIC